MALIKAGQLVDDAFISVADDAALPAAGAVIVSLERWQASGEALLRRDEPVGVRLRSDEPPELIGDGLGKLAVIALEFPAFRDGRAYSYARLLCSRSPLVPDKKNSNPRPNRRSTICASLTWRNETRNEGPANAPPARPTREDRCIRPVVAGKGRPAKMLASGPGPRDPGVPCRYCAPA